MFGRHENQTFDRQLAREVRHCTMHTLQSSSWSPSSSPLTCCTSVSVLVLVSASASYRCTDSRTLQQARAQQPRSPQQVSRPRKRPASRRLSRNSGLGNISRAGSRVGREATASSLGQTCKPCFTNNARRYH